MTCQEHHILVDLVEEIVAFLKEHGATDEHIKYAAELLKKKTSKSNELLDGFRAKLSR
jgi:hypothetical protein